MLPNRSQGFVLNRGDNILEDTGMEAASVWRAVIKSSQAEPGGRSLEGSRQSMGSNPFARIETQVCVIPGRYRVRWSTFT